MVYPQNPLSQEVQAAADQYREAGREQEAVYHEENIRQLNNITAKQTDNTEENQYADESYKITILRLQQNKSREEILQRSSLVIDEWPKNGWYVLPQNRTTEWPPQATEQ